jgi:diadenosine tetraphosphate (Ap4A) HIT family hydrolase
MRPGVYKGLAYDENGMVVNSLFSDIAAGILSPEGEPQRLLYKDEACVIFMARRGESRTHLLVVPHRPVKSWVELVKEGLGAPAPLPELRGRQLLQHMEAVGRVYISKEGPDAEYRIYPAHVQMGFHSPPYNSIDHLHLHILDRSKMHPQLRAYAKFPLSVSTPWYRPLSDVYRAFEKGVGEIIPPNPNRT